MTTVEKAELAQTQPTVDARRARSVALNAFVYNNRLWIGTLAFFVVLLLIFISINPTVFLGAAIYKSLMLTVPIAIFLVVPAVFVVTSGEIDLSFPSVMGMSAWAFAVTVQAGYDPTEAIAVASRSINWSSSSVSN